MNWPLLSNSLLVAALAAALAAGFGFAVALWLSTLPSRRQQAGLATAMVALALPPFLVSNTWLFLLGHAGVLRSWWPLEIYSLGGAAWLLALLDWPIPLLFTLAAFRRVQAAQLESHPGLRGVALIRWLLWPMARRPLIQASALVFVLALNNFAVPSLLQVKVFPAEMWLRFNTGLNDAAAWAVSWPLIVMPLLLLIVLRGVSVRWPRSEEGATAAMLRRQLGPATRWTVRFAAVAVLGLSVALPLVQILTSSQTWREIPLLFRAAPAVIGHSAFYALAASSLALLLAVLTWRWPVGNGLWVLFLVPGVLLGRALVWVFNRPPLEALYATAALVVLAFVLRYQAILWHATVEAMRAVDVELIDAARQCGAAGWPLFRHAHGPQIAPTLGAAWYVTYLLCLWDVETLILIYPPGGETLALRAFNLLHYGHNAQVNAMCLVLLGLAIAPLVIWALARRISKHR